MHRYVQRRKRVRWFKVDKNESGEKIEKTFKLVDNFYDSQDFILFILHKKEPEVN